MGDILNLDSLIKEGISLASNYGKSDDFYGTGYIEYNQYTEWARKSLMFLQENFPNHPQTGNFEDLVLNGNNETSYYQRLLGILKAFNSIKPQGTDKVDHEKTLALIFNRFHILARQIRSRHNGRSTIQIQDEYDVQDLLNAILCMFFDDVRPEEWTDKWLKQQQPKRL